MVDSGIDSSSLLGHHQLAHLGSLLLQVTLNLLLLGLDFLGLLIIVRAGIFISLLIIFFFLLFLLDLSLFLSFLGVNLVFLIDVKLHRGLGDSLKSIDLVLSGGDVTLSLVVNEWRQVSRGNLARLVLSNREADLVVKRVVDPLGKDIISSHF